MVASLTTTASLAIVSLTATDSFFIITTVSSLVLISFRLASLHGTPGTPHGGIPGIPLTHPTMGTPTILPILAADRSSITVIGLIWPYQCNRSLPSAAITRGRLTG
jgi:hypothetical protein